MRDTAMKSNKINGRRQEREEAFILVFERMFKDDSSAEVIESAIEARDASVGEFTRFITDGVYDNLEVIDEAIEKNLKGWKKNRISKVALTLMRIAVFELMFSENTPTSVAISEAVQLCKKYASDEDAAFLNGVLGGVSRMNEKNGEK